MPYSGVVGSPCNATSECRAVDLSSHCDASDHVCVCDQGRIPSDDRRRCFVPHLDAEIAVVAVCVVVICFLIFLTAFLLVWLCKAFVCVKAGQHPPSTVTELFAVIGHNRPHDGLVV